MDLVDIYGLIIDGIKDIGKIIECMEMVYILGMMGEVIKVNIIWIKNKVKEYIHGLMDESLMDIGLMESKKEQEKWFIPTEKLNKVYGKMGK